MVVNLYKVSVMYKDVQVHVDCCGTSEQTDFLSQVYQRLGIDTTLKKFNPDHIKITKVEFVKKLGLDGI